MSLLLERGERGIIIGQTGSGKTVGAIWHVRSVSQWPVIIFDTKIEPAFDGVALPGESSEIIESGDDFLKQWKSKKQPDYLIVRPTAGELANPAELDDLLQAFYAAGKSAFVYIDEAYQWHVQGRAGAGLTGLLTRGRSKKMTTLLSSQRPAWVSRFCFTEVQKYYIYRLSDRRDLQSIENYIPGMAACPLPAKRHFWFYEAGESEKPEYFAPVPYFQHPDKPNDKLTKKGWI